MADETAKQSESTGQKTSRDVLCAFWSFWDNLVPLLPPDLDPVSVDRAHWSIYHIIHALAYSDPARLERIGAAYRLLRAAPAEDSTDFAQQLFYLRIIRSVADMASGHRETADFFAEEWRKWLAYEAHPAFAKLDLGSLASTLSRISSKTGRGHIKAIGAAAILAVEVGAWEFDKLDQDKARCLDKAGDKLAQVQRKGRERAKKGIR